MKTNPNYQANLDKLAYRPKARRKELENIERHAIANFAGQFSDLEAAIGVLRVGDHLGWKALILIHNKRTIRKYEDILDIQIREIFPDEGPSIDRSVGYMLAKKLGNFWKAVSGDLKIDGRREFSK